MRAILAVMMLAGSAAWAQSSNGTGAGTISGMLTDADGRALPMTPVQATNTASKAVFKATSSAKGEYSIGQLPAGTYDVSVAVSALVFRPFVRSGVVLGAGQTLRLDIRLQDGITLNTLGEDREALALMFGRLKPPDGPTPLLSNGKPDLSGFWMAAGLPDDPSTVVSKLEALPWAETLAKQRVANDFRDIPSARCLPNGITVQIGGSEFVHTPSRLVMLLEGGPPRMVYVDGRRHGSDLNPTWLGHSVGTWEGDTLVVDSVGFNDKTWLDMEAHPHTDKMHVIERFRRKDLGHMESEVTVEDTGALVKPWVHKQGYVLNPKDGVQENLCVENERDGAHLSSDSAQNAPGARK